MRWDLSWKELKRLGWTVENTAPVDKTIRNHCCWAFGVIIGCTGSAEPSKTLQLSTNPRKRPSKTLHLLTKPRKPHSKTFHLSTNPRRRPSKGVTIESTKF